MKITVVGAVVTVAVMIAACLLVDLLLDTLNKRRGEDGQQQGG